MAESAAVRAIFRETVKRMESLGVYRPEYDGTIQVYAQIVDQYRVLTERFEQGEYEIQSFSAAGGLKKAPIVATLESLRKDILAYSTALCLNPKAMREQGTKEAPKASKLDVALAKLNLG